VVKHRISPFVGTDLETLLRANGIDTLVLAGGSGCCSVRRQPVTA
jgi:nicotinamidase-related amidase